MRYFFTFSRFTLLVALSISAIAAWYSIIGLTAIFAGAVIPIIIMGSILEIAKITTTIWLHKFWKKSGFFIKTYLSIAVVVLACLTSMGIFGLLSKAHVDQGIDGSNINAKIEMIDDKISIQKEIIADSRKNLTQLDEQVNQMISRSKNTGGVLSSNTIRRQQSRERKNIDNTIINAQKNIQKLQEERAPLAVQMRKVEAEVGPVKYIAALVYGDDPDVNTLERAVRWVIILIVSVFDPLAIILIIAANNGLLWEREKRTKSKEVLSDNLKNDDEFDSFFLDDSKKKSLT